MQPNQKQVLTKGIIYAVVAGVLWGISAICAQFLFQFREIEPRWLVSARLLFSGTMLILYSSFTHGKAVFDIFKSRMDTLQVFAFGICGMMGVQFMYFTAIQASNAATATVLQYLGPVLIASYYALRRRRWPAGRERMAIVLAVLGTFLLVTHGDISKLSISKAALFWGLGGAMALAFNSIFPITLLRKFESTIVLGWAMFIGGVTISCLMTPPWAVSGIWDMSTFLATGFILVFGSLIAFYLYLNAIHSIGAEISSLLATVQPLSATILAVLVMGVPFILVDYLGAACIITTIVILAKKK